MKIGENEEKMSEKLGNEENNSSGTKNDIEKINIIKENVETKTIESKYELKNLEKLLKIKDIECLKYLYDKEYEKKSLEFNTYLAEKKCEDHLKSKPFIDFKNIIKQQLEFLIKKLEDLLKERKTNIYLICNQQSGPINEIKEKDLVEKYKKLFVKQDDIELIISYHNQIINNYFYPNNYYYNYSYPSLISGYQEQIPFNQQQKNTNYQCQINNLQINGNYQANTYGQQPNLFYHQNIPFYQPTDNNQYLIHPFNQQQNLNNQFINQQNINNYQQGNPLYKNQQFIIPPYIENLLYLQQNPQFQQFNQMLQHITFSNNLMNNQIEEEKLISINFISNEEDLYCSIICKSSDKFEKVELQLYGEYPEYSKNQNLFFINGIKIDKKKSLKENGIKNNSLIIIK